MTARECAAIVLLIVYLLALAFRAYDLHRTTRRHELLQNRRAILWDRLYDYARRLGVLVLIVDSFDTDGYRRFHNTTVGLCVRQRRGLGPQIRILRECFGDWIVLAHEIGHHLAIDYYGDRSEAAANREGLRAALSVLTAKERAILGDKVSAEMKG